MYSLQSGSLCGMDSVTWFILLAETFKSFHSVVAVQETLRFSSRHTENYIGHWTQQKIKNIKIKKITKNNKTKQKRRTSVDNAKFEWLLFIRLFSKRRSIPLVS